MSDFWRWKYLVLLVAVCVALPITCPAGDNWPFVGFDSSTLQPPSRVGVLVVFAKPIQRGVLMRPLWTKKATPEEQEAEQRTRQKVQSVIETSVSGQLNARGFVPVVLSAPGLEFERGVPLEPGVVAASKPANVAATIVIIPDIGVGTGWTSSRREQQFLHINLQPEMVATDGKVLGRAIGCSVTEAFFLDLRKFVLKDGRELSEEVANCVLATFGLTAAGANSQTGSESGANGNPFFGTWKLRSSAAKFQNGMAPASETTVFERAEASMNLVVNRTSAKGKPLTASFRLEPDGKPHPFPDRNAAKPFYSLFWGQYASLYGPESIATVLAGRVLDTTVWGKEGSVILHQTWALSADGKSMTFTQYGHNGPNYSSYTNVAVYERE